MLPAHIKRIEKLAGKGGLQPVTSNIKFRWDSSALTDEGALQMRQQYFGNIDSSTRARSSAIAKFKNARIQSLLNGLDSLFLKELYKGIKARYNIIKEICDRSDKYNKTKQAEEATRQENLRQREAAKEARGDSILGQDSQHLINGVTTLITRGGLEALGLVDLEEETLTDDGVSYLKALVGFQNISEPERTHGLFIKALLGLEIYCLWKFAFSSEKHLKSIIKGPDGNLVLSKNIDIGEGSLDERLITGSIELFNLLPSELKQGKIHTYKKKRSEENTPGHKSVISKIKKIKKAAKKILKEQGGSGIPRFVINNAARTDLFGIEKTNIICADSSIADGMSQCSFDSARDRRWSSSIIFILQDTDQLQFYQGISKPGVTNESLKYSIEVQFGMNDYFSFSQDFNIRTGHQLEANYVYSVLLEKIELEFKKIYDGGGERSIVEIWKDASYQRNVGSMFSIFIETLMLKGAGDLYQEMNSVLPNGGINTDEVASGISGATVIKYDSNGNGLRFGAMGDRPSGFRPALLNYLSNVRELAPPMNQLNLSGYLGENIGLIIETLEISALAGGKRRRRKTKKRRKSRKLKKNKKKYFRKTKRETAKKT